MATTNTLPVKAEAPKVPAKVADSKAPKAQAPKAQESKATKVGIWDKLAFEAVVFLLKDHPKGVTVSQVVDYINKLPKGSLPPGQTSVRGRVMDNTLWRLCPATEGDKQAGGGYYPSPGLLVRNRGSRPITFTLANPKVRAFPK